MPYKKITVQPGFNTEATQTLNEGGWSKGNLIKFRLGLIEKLPGWKELFAQACAGIVRALHAYADLYGVETLLIAGDGGPQIYADGVLESFQLFQNIGSDVTFSSTLGSPTITVGNVPFPVSIGDLIYLPQKTSIGGYFYPAKSYVGVLTESTGTFTFSLPINASRSDSNIRGVPVLSYGTYDTNEAHVQVTYYGNGLSIGGTFSFDLTTSFIQNVGSTQYNLSVEEGFAYPVIAIVDANNFVINIPAFASYPLITKVLISGSVYSGTNEVDGPQIADFGSNPGTVFSYHTSGNSFFIPAHNTLATTPIGGSGAWIMVSIFTPNPPSVTFGNNWSLDNFGQFGLFCQAGGPIYQYTPPLSSAAGLVNLGMSAPQVNQGMFVSMPQAQVIAFGSEATIGGGTQDPLLVRWSDVGNQYDFIATVTNQAGSLRLSRGSKCVGGLQAPQATLIWTDVDLWSMQYIGVGSGDLIYSFTILGSGCGLIAQNARCVGGTTTYWMGQESFWIFNANGPQPVDCPIWDTIFNNLNRSLSSKIAAGFDSGTQEVFFFYPSMQSAGENDSYVKYNTLENFWDYGSIDRTSWIDQSVFGAPLGSDLQLLIQQHDSGYDANGAVMSGAFAETGFFDISDGDMLMFFDLIIPDFKWFGIDGYVQLTFWAKQTPGDEPTMYGPFPVTPTSGIISTGGVRARQIALRIDWGLATGFSARLGAIRIRMAPAGRV